MRLPVPGAPLLAILAIGLFILAQRSQRNRRENNRQRYTDRHEELLELLREQKAREQNESELEEEKPKSE